MPVPKAFGVAARFSARAATAAGDVSSGGGSLSAALSAPLAQGWS